MGVQNINRGLVLTGILGVMVSTYTLYVEMAAESRPGYKALCDLAEHASCSRVLTSEYVLQAKLKKTYVNYKI